MNVHGIRIAAALIVTALGCGEPGGSSGTNHPRATSIVRPPTLNETTLLAAIERANRGDWSHVEELGLAMNGFDWGRDFSLGVRSGESLRAAAIARMWGSYLFVFGANGQLAARANTPGEILSIELFDFDANGCDEIITRQKTGWGTGVYTEEFIIYGFTKSREIRQLWKGTSYSYLDATERKADFEEEEGFLRPSYQHLLFTSTSEKHGRRTSRRRMFDFDGEAFTAASRSRPNAGVVAPCG